LIEARARDQAQAARRDADLVLDLADYPVGVSEDYLAKIVDELTQNAFRFSQRGSPVRIELKDLPGFVALSITDRGSGFSTEHIRKVGAYMQFDRKLHEQQGLGLGLTIAKRLTELHGGTLSIESRRGATTTVSARLPKAAG
jgi:signal transduction histidine kinase